MGIASLGKPLGFPGCSDTVNIYSQGVTFSLFFALITVVALTALGWLFN